MSFGSRVMLSKFLTAGCRSFLADGSSGIRVGALPLTQVQACRRKMKDVDLPVVFGVGAKAGKYRRIVHFPEEYTIRPLDVTNLGGRDPASGRVVVKGIGGGIKRKYHWIEWKRIGPKEGPPLEERVLEIMIDWCRTARIALVGSGNQLKYILATENMKPGDIIRTSMAIPRIPVLAKEGDAYPLGALQMGTVVNNVEMFAGNGGFFVHAAGTCATLLRRIGDFIVIRLPSGKEVALPQENMATVGRLSNVEHSSIPVGSAQRNRELGNRPRSGLWQRKTGRFGRKIHPPSPLQFIVPKDKIEPEVMKLTLNNDGYFTQKLQAHLSIV
ncbi:Ribosomal protein L2 [Nesidiocoris tenuis]|uniref:Ribosomal protein L2 n=2 Tax=Nesidiocoris tenuis TaxID=355587 RepID=A0ABN7B2A9_9HEMI|nr:Ribosomal protein L2 [Nesidiocoris tenuis]